MLSRPTLVTLLLASGCASAASEREAPPPAASTPDASAPVENFGDGGTDSPPTDDCADTSKFVYVIDGESRLRRFDPSNSTFSAVGQIDCGPAAGAPFSMAVARNGIAWVLFDAGDLYKVSTKDAACSGTSFRPPNGWSHFGMGFVSDEDEGKSETLYVANVSGQLGKIALDTMTITPVGPLAVSARMELTGTGSGQLFALLAPAKSPGVWSVAEIAKSSGQFVSQKDTGIEEASNLNFAFAAWGGDFYSFVGLSVYRYASKTAQVTKVTDVTFRIVGAGVSTCAPHAIVK